MTWSDEVPTEDGWYWVRHKGLRNDEVAYFGGNGNIVMGGVEDYFADACVDVGPRIPTPEELEAMRLQHDKLINAISASWTALNDAMKLILKGGAT